MIDRDGTMTWFSDSYYTYDSRHSAALGLLFAGSFLIYLFWVSTLVNIYNDLYLCIIILSFTV